LQRESTFLNCSIFVQSEILVQVWSEDEDQLLATVLAISDERPLASDKTVFNLEQFSTDSTPALRSCSIQGNDWTKICLSPIPDEQSHRQHWLGSLNRSAGWRRAIRRANLKIANARSFRKLSGSLVVFPGDQRARKRSARNRPREFGYIVLEM